MTEAPDAPRLRLRIVFPDGRWMGPGKAELLERIDRTGSISAAGREMGMSYKRAWQLVEAMNALFREPLVESVRGGAKGGGATVTETGRKALEAYVGVVTAARNAGAEQIAALEALRGDMVERK